jgi:hypothetical protein
MVIGDSWRRERVTRDAKRKTGFAGKLARAIYDENETSLSPTRFWVPFSLVLGRPGTPSLAAMAEDSGRWWIARQAM